jgi:hypothetical protein
MSCPVGASAVLALGATMILRPEWLMSRAAVGIPARPLLLSRVQTEFPC